MRSLQKEGVSEDYSDVTKFWTFIQQEVILAWLPTTKSNYWAPSRHLLNADEIDVGTTALGSLFANGVVLDCFTSFAK